jgi:hypothetical protein
MARPTARTALERKAPLHTETLIARATDERASLVASFAAGVRELVLERTAPFRTDVSIATSDAAPASCGAFADERRIVAGEEGDRVY